MLFLLFHSSTYLARLTVIYPNLTLSVIAERSTCRLTTGHYLGELRHIHKLRFWPIESVLHDKYLLSQRDAGLIGSFITPMLRLHPEKRARASEMIHHTWLEGITVQGETLAIRAAEEADSRARQEVAAANTRGSSSGADGEGSVSPSGNRASGSNVARAAEAQDERDAGAVSSRDKRVSIGFVPSKEDEADALKPVHSGKNSPVEHSTSPPPPGTTLSMTPGPSNPPQDRPHPKEQVQLKSSKLKPGSKSKSKTKTQQQQQRPPVAAMESGLNVDGSSAQTQGSQPPQSQRLVSPAS